jgi:hypothetical protein
MRDRLEAAIAAHPVVATVVFAALVAVVDLTLDVLVLGAVSPGRTLLFVVAFTALFVVSIRDIADLDLF